MIKMLYRLTELDKAAWLEGDKKISDAKSLKELIDELVDKGNWTIIAATTEYIILQKVDLKQKMKESMEAMDEAILDEEDEHEPDEDIV